MMYPMIFDFCTDLERVGILDKYMEKCASLPSLRDRVRFSDRIIKSHSNYFEVNAGEKISVKKNDKDSLDYRKTGNTLYRARKYSQALAAYNKSICFAASDEYIATAYSNRSAVLFEMGDFRDCLENIRLANSFKDLPQQIRKRLNKRNKKSRQRLSQQHIPDPDRSTPNLSYSEHPQVPFVVDCLDVKRDENNYWIYTKKALKPGDIIARPQLFLCQLQTVVSEACSYCLKVKKNTMIPCKNCTQVMYCNENCMEKANEEFHKWECPIIDHMKALLENDPVSSSAFRLLLNMLNVFRDVEELENFFAHRNPNLSYFSLNRATFDQKQHYRVLCSALSKKEFPDYEYFFYGILSSLLRKEAMKHSGLKDLFITEDQRELFSEVLYRHMLISCRHCPSLYLNEVKTDKEYVLAHYNSAIEFEIKISNKPNVSISWLNNNQISNIVLKVERPIAKNEILILPDAKTSEKQTSELLASHKFFANLTIFELAKCLFRGRF